MRTIASSCKTESRPMKIAKAKCTDALDHDADLTDGRCQWCGKKVERARARVHRDPEPSELDDAYRYMWDPDYAE